MPKHGSPPLPRLAITLGDPTGIGPEIVARALMEPALYSLCKPYVVGRPEVLKQAAVQFGCSASIESLREPDSFDPSTSQWGCIVAGSPEAADAPHGVIDARGGQAAYDALMMGADLALAGSVEAIVTAPLHKEALHAAGHHWPGHTELLADRCGVSSFAMMLYLPPRGLDSKSARIQEAPTASAAATKGSGGSMGRGGPVGLGVVHVTLHMAMREIFQHITRQSVFEKIELTEKVFSRLKKSLGLGGPPSIAVAALNPHAGEHGLFGDEEETTIRPAVEQAKALGWKVEGPLPVDTLMGRAAAGEFDAVVAMYHDQGHIALKLLDMLDAVNITLGLPILRTSVAHGTAHDQAWRGTASASGMIQAIRTAAWLAGTR